MSKSMMPIVQTTADYKNCIPYICMCVSITKSLILNKIATVKKQNLQRITV